MNTWGSEVGGKIYVFGGWVGSSKWPENNAKGIAA